MQQMLQLWDDLSVSYPQAQLTVHGHTPSFTHSSAHSLAFSCIHGSVLEKKTFLASLIRYWGARAAEREDEQLDSAKQRQMGRLAQFYAEQNKVLDSFEEADKLITRHNSKVGAPTIELSMDSLMESVLNVHVWR